jgi:hypothetical protein
VPQVQLTGATPGVAAALAAADLSESYARTTGPWTRYRSWRCVSLGLVSASGWRNSSKSGLLYGLDQSGRCGRRRALRAQDGSGDRDGRDH